MNATRRTCLAVLCSGIASQQVLAQNTKAASTITVRGEIQSEAGASVDPGLIEIVSFETGAERAQVENGTFESSLESDNSYDINFWHETQSGDYITDSDDVPLFYNLENDIVIAEDDTDLGTYELPEAYETQIRFEDMDGNPVQDLHIGFRLPTGTGTGPQQFFTNSQGYVYHDEESNTGVALAGDVDIEVQDPTDHTDSITPMQLSITEDQEISIPLQNPEEWGGAIVGSESNSDDSDTDETESSDSETDQTESDDSEIDQTESDDSEIDQTESNIDQDTSDETENTAQTESNNDRGFFTNDPNSSVAFLNDPVTLTWGGIAVSIAGIVMQLLGGDS